ncbi:hypothetical protein K4L06_21895 [Lysobacter sp. BMK333-48F3]|uniref:hypothetical protein n=1 Tax=Lysobacter sp. BMK333-48F3 TaxID=2867962 RepID=UPI001C8BE47B|nr:hypothetical protein [Lysobacter sp. BMK333-48F3]MBX9403961.1 hypothetical protein [Lysobacter sp. BMK333-48F3]
MQDSLRALPRYLLVLATVSALACLAQTVAPSSAPTPAVSPGSTSLPASRTGPDTLMFVVASAASASAREPDAALGLPRYARTAPAPVSPVSPTPFAPLAARLRPAQATPR